MDEITLPINVFCDRLRNVMREEAQLAADRKELELMGKASGINVAAVKKWIRAEVQDEEASRPTKVAKLVAQTQDQVLYGESLGHDLGMFQNNASAEKVSVRNNSKAASATHPEAAQGGDVTSLPASPPTISTGALTAAGTGGEGDGAHTPPRTPELPSSIDRGAQHGA